MDRVRFTSLDVFRGLAICLMIVVNTQGAGAKPYPLLEHADWFGFTAADIVFPSFLFATGNAMAFGSKLPEAAFWIKTLRRTAIIFALGVFLYWFPFVQHTDAGWVIKPFSDTRILGVLQRIALCYGLTAVAARYLGVRGLIVLSLILLFGYWAVLMYAGPVGEQLSKAHNVGNAIDLAIVGKSHLYKWDEGFEPEGLLGTLPATVNVIWGYLAGLYIRKHTPSRFVAMRFLGAGVLLIVLALGWNTIFPIGKKLWTSSFVLLTVGIDLVVLSGLISLIDLSGFREKGRAVVRFFEIFGRNPLIIYLFSELLIVLLWMIPIGKQDFWTWVGTSVFQPVTPGALGALLCAIAYTLVCWLVAWALDVKKIIIKV